MLQNHTRARFVIRFRRVGFKCSGPSIAIERMIWAALKKGCRPLVYGVAQWNKEFVLSAKIFMSNHVKAVLNQSINLRNTGAVAYIPGYTLQHGKNVAMDEKMVFILIELQFNHFFIISKFRNVLLIIVDCQGQVVHKE